MKAYVEKAMDFNPRPRAGGDKKGRSDRRCTQRFQSTPPRRGRLAELKRALLFLKFQSTPPRRGRLAEEARLHPEAAISIHAPAQGATRIAEIPLPPSTDFNPRPRAGGDAG